MTGALTASGLFGTLYADPAVVAEFGGAAMVAWMLRVEAAWTRALAAEGAVAQADAQAALAAIEGADAAVLLPRLGTGSDRDGLPVPALVKALRADLPEGAAAAIHTGLTSQDVLDTALVLALLAVLDDLGDRLGRVLAGLEDLTARFGDRPLTARTRMQAALPATVDLRLDAWRRPLADHAGRLPPLRAELGRVQVGGPVGAREMPEARVAHVGATLGLAHGPVWHTDRSAMVACGHWLTLVAGILGKVGTDAALMAQQGEIVLADAGGSSAMPHKRNPIRAEALATLARIVAGQQGVLAQAMIHEQERSGTAWALEWLTLPAMAEATGAALSGAAALLSSVTRIGG